MIVQCGSFKSKQVDRNCVSRPVRHGKTKRDHANGNPGRNLMRKELRTAWLQDNQARNDTFPV